MNISDFDFDLPEDLIAQTPSDQRTGSRLLHLNRESGHWQHRQFTDVLNCLPNQPLIVMNNTRVLPAKLRGYRLDTGKPLEILLVQEETPATWTALVKGLNRLKPGLEVAFDPDDPARLKAQFLGAREELAIFRLEAHDGNLTGALEALGYPPLPPYIKRDGDELLALDRERYQTVFAAEPGAIAAPTAGLHFSEELLQEVRKTTDVAFLTLHVGVGTFQPVRTEQVEEHRMLKEYYRVPEQTMQLLVEAKKEGRPVLAVGTTCVRVLESLEIGSDNPGPLSGWTNKFIYPGYRFQNVDRLLTNFHLPRSTLFMLVSAFAGLPLMQQVYQDAIQRGYRFFSYGDAMLID